MSDSANVGLGELLALLAYRMKSPLRCDNPSLAIPDAPDFFRRIPEGFMDMLPETDGSSIYVHFAAGEWLTARELLFWTVMEGRSGPVVIPLLALALEDPSMKSLRLATANIVADALTYGLSHPLLDGVLDHPGAIQFILMFAEEATIMTLLEAHLAQRRDLSGELRTTCAVGACDEIFAELIFDLMNEPGALHSLSSLSDASDLAARLHRLGLADRFGQHLLKLRPPSVEDAEGQIAIIEKLVQLARLRPEPSALVEVVRHFCEILAGVELPSLQDVLANLAGRSIDQHMPRAAAYWSLASNAAMSRAIAYARALHETCTANDLDLLNQVFETTLDFSMATTDQLEQILLGLRRARMLAGARLELRARADELAASCRNALLAIGWSEDKDSASEFNQEEVSELERAETEAIDFDLGFFGFDRDRLDHFPYAIDGDFETDAAGRTRFTEPYLMTRAFQMVSERRLGPHDLLQVADSSLELGDVRHANSLVRHAAQIYPRSLEVLAAQAKLAIHASRESEALLAFELLRTELDLGPEHNSPREIVRVLLTVTKAFLDFAPDTIQKLLAHPRMFTFADQLSVRFPPSA